jgi:hypothetical protein
MQQPQPNFTVVNSLKLAWFSLHKTFLKVWVTLIPVITLLVIFSALLKGLQHHFNHPLSAHPMIGMILHTIIVLFISLSFITGCTMLNVRSQNNETLHFKDGFAYFNRIIHLTIGACIVVLIQGAWSLINIYIIRFALSHQLVTQLSIFNGYVIFYQIVNLIIAVITFNTLPLIADKKYNGFQAIICSIKTLSTPKNLLHGLLAMISLTLILFAAIAPLMLLNNAANHSIAIAGKIITIVLSFWLTPFIFSVQAAVYNLTFGFKNN